MVRRTVFLLLILCGLTAQMSLKAQSVFVRASLPCGLVWAKNNYLFADIDRTTDHGIGVYNTSGQMAGYIKTGGFTSLGSHYLATIPSSGYILALHSQGVLRIIDPSNGAQAVWADLKNFSHDTDRIYDVSTDTYWNGGGMIDPKTASWGDIAVLERGDTLDVLCSGMSYAQTFPFLLRMRIRGNRLISSKVIVTSRASTAGSYNNSRGVAVNSSGRVLMTLPRGGNLGNYDRMHSFNIDFPEKQTNLPTLMLNGNWIYSNGMTTDSAGNFYVATGKMGSAYGGSGDVIRIDSTGNRAVKRYSFNSALADSRDVTLNLGEDRVFVSLLQGNTIYWFTK